MSRRPAMCLTLRFSPRCGLSNSHSATRMEKRLVGATEGGVEEEETEAERNFIKHCGADQKARNFTLFFLQVKLKISQHARPRASARDNPQKLWITQWTTAF
ncbi:hypothetical protein EMIT0P74_50311 [Pseudomonas sp. IT-P74]